MLPPERDLLAWLVAIFTISTGLVIALAALFAYAVQRARYLRDIAPELRLERPPSFPALVTESPNWNVRCDLVNSSADNDAEDVNVSYRLQYALGQSFASQINLGRVLAGTHINFGLPFSSESLLTAVNRSDDSKPPGVLEIKVTYFTPREFVLFLLHPLGLGRKRYVRSFQVMWHWYPWETEEHKGWNVGDEEMVSS